MGSKRRRTRQQILDEKEEARLKEESIEQRLGQLDALAQAYKEMKAKAERNDGASEILQGTGYIPRGPETQIYSVENTNLNLVATAEITLGGMLAGQVVDAAQLPLKMVGISHCFRTEAGAAGRATRGLFRVHQFTKI